MKAKTSNIRKKKEQKLTYTLVKKILRTVPQNEAFYFNTDIGQYTGVYATSLDNFCKKIKFLELKSVLFHFDRNDFEKWIKGTIGDSYLAERISEIRKSVDREDYRNEIYLTITDRLSQLKRLLASEDLHIEHF
jgi:hypothetical protein